MKKYILLLAIIVATTSSVYSQSNDNDFQFWNETKVYFKTINKTDTGGKKEKFISPFVMGTIRGGQNFKHFVSERVGAGFEVRLNKYFKVTPSYYYIAEQPAKNRKSIEHRLRIEIEGEKEFSRVTLSNRNRVEHRLRFNRANATRYRNRTKLKIPINNSEGKEIVTPYVSDEPYYDFTAKRWSRNEFSAGVGKKLNKNISGEAFYLLQNNIGRTLRNVHAFGVNLKFTID